MVSYQRHAPLAEGSSQTAGRPQRPHSAKLADAGGGASLKVYPNTLYDAGGDVLAAQAADGSAVVPVPPRPALSSSQKFQQQRALAAQKRLERLQLGGVAQSNDSIAVVTLGSRPGTPGCAKPPPGGAATGPGLAGGDASSAPAASGGGGAQPALEAWASSGARPRSAASAALAAKGLAGVYDPHAAAPGRPDSTATDDDSGGGDGAPAAVPAPMPSSRLDASELAAFLLRPGPRAGQVLCFIEREKGGVGKAPCYRLHLDDSRALLLTARKRASASGAHYVLSTAPPGELARGSPGFLGKLRSNFAGTEYSLLTEPQLAAQGGAALVPRGGRMVAAASSSTRQLHRSASGGGGGGGGGGGCKGLVEVAAVAFELNLLGTRGPRRMAVAVPARAPDGAPRSGAGGEGAAVLRNRSPRWNEALNAYCLNFSGRVTEASVKNFQLVAAEGEGEGVVLQFGKVSDGVFTCDYAWPLCPLQAFGIALASFDDKLACDQILSGRWGRRSASAPRSGRAAPRSSGSSAAAAMRFFTLRKRRAKGAEQLLRMESAREQSSAALCALEEERERLLLEHALAQASCQLLAWLRQALCDSDAVSAAEAQLLQQLWDVPAPAGAPQLLPPRAPPAALAPGGAPQQQRLAAPPDDVLQALRRALEQPPPPGLAAMGRPEIAAEYRRCIEEWSLNLSLVDAYEAAGAPPGLGARAQLPLAQVEQVSIRWFGIQASLTLADRASHVTELLTTDMQTLAQLPEPDKEHHAWAVAQVGLTRAQERRIVAGLAWFKRNLNPMLEELAALQQACADSGGGGRGDGDRTRAAVEAHAEYRQRLAAEAARADRIGVVMRKDFLHRMVWAGFLWGSLTWTQIARLHVLMFPYVPMPACIGTVIYGASVATASC
ncbi:TULP1 [Scenedesmus sp. PABB004]|nr:TULP1 [Scenedesmus sp. PABB004]